MVNGTIVRDASGFNASRKPSVGGTRGRKPSELTNTIRSLAAGESFVYAFPGDHNDLEAYEKWRTQTSSIVNRRMKNDAGESVPAYGFSLRMTQDFDGRQIQITRLTDAEATARQEKRAARTAEAV